MFDYTILYYTILYYTILYYTILYYTILYYTILYYTILYRIISEKCKQTVKTGFGRNKKNIDRVPYDKMFPIRLKDKHVILPSNHE